MLDYVDDLVHSQDEPLADWVCVPLYFVSKLAKDSGVTVIQVGEGADEQFCGYPSYLLYLKAARNYYEPFRKYLPHTLQELVAGAANLVSRVDPRFEVYADLISRAAHDRQIFWTGAISFWDNMKCQLVRSDAFVDTIQRQPMINSDLLPKSYLQLDSFNIIKKFVDDMDSAGVEHDLLAQMIYNEFKLRLPELLLMRVDKITMSTSVEARVPFLSHELVEFTMDIPMSLKVPSGDPKHLLKKAVRGLIPDELIDRKKMGFGAPMSQWLHSDFGRQAEASILRSRLLERGFFNVDYIKDLFADHRSRRRDNALYIWTIFNLSTWYDYWIDGRTAT
jgi:asparagine synthase (glutamine-hydrolysing)